jgi:hypothetical protein
LTKNGESLEEKVERLEYYIDLLRDYIVDQEQFILWDWAIANRLNRDEVRSIIDISKAFNKQIQSSEQLPQLNDFIKEIKRILSSRSDITVNEKFTIQLLKRISNMGMFQHLTHHFLKA